MAAGMRWEEVLTHTEVAVPAPVLGPPFCGVWVGELHEVDHLRAYPQPGTAIWQLVMRAIWVDLQATHLNTL